jgi:hypothetical protein
MLNLTRLHLGIAHESQFQGLGISRCASVAGGAGRPSAAGHAANAGTKPYCRASSIISAVRRSSSSRPCGSLRCVERCCPSAAQARRSETCSCARTCSMQARRRAGLRSFPGQPPANELIQCQIGNRLAQPPAKGERGRVFIAARYPLHTIAIYANLLQPEPDELRSQSCRCPSANPKLDGRRLTDPGRFDILVFGSGSGGSYAIRKSSRSINRFLMLHGRLGRWSWRPLGLAIARHMEWRAPNVTTH